MTTGTNPDIRYCAQCGQPGAIDSFARFGDTPICSNCKYSYLQRLREGVAAGRPGFRYAGFWIRFVASLIDGVVLFVAGSAVQVLLMGNAFNPFLRMRPGAPPEETLAAFGSLIGLLGLSMLISVAMAACYYGFFVARAGATPGKMALNLKIVRPDGGPVSGGRAVGRYFATWLSSITFGIGYIMAGVDSEKRAMHDMICDTRVVKADSLAADPYARPV